MKKRTLQQMIWMPFTAFLFIGLGLGMYFEQTAAGVLVGMGLGFLASTALWLKYRKEL